ncbi:MAG: hypothetical protein ACR2NN_08870 [Bryobacteraceae bacterium]
MMSGLVRDVTHAWRLIEKSPGFTCLIVLLLALGIGVNTLVFSVLDALLLRKLPVRNADLLVRVVEIRPVLGARSYFPYSYVVLLGHKQNILM